MKMMFKLLLLTILASSLSPILSAQTVTVTGTITDTGTTPYSNGSLTITLVNSTGQQATFGGSPSFQTTYSASLDANGSFSISLPPNSTATPSIRPPGTQWNFSYQSQGGYGAANINVTITSSGSITGTLSGLTRITWPLGRTAPPGGVGQGIVVVSSTTLGWGAAGGGTGLSGPAFSIGTGSAQAQTVQPVTPITDATLAAAVATTGGFEICWAPAASNTATNPTLAGAGTSTFSAHTIFKTGGFFALVANDIQITTIACAIWDGLAFELQNPMAGLAATGSLTLGGGAATVGSGSTGGYGAGEATSTGFTPTAGQDYKRADSTLHNFVSSLNGAAEVPDPFYSAVPVGGKCLQSLGVAGSIAEAAAACGGSPSYPVTVTGGVSGAVPCFTSTTVESAGTLLATNALVAGGGAGACPSTGSGDFTYVTHTLAGSAAAIFDMHLAGKQAFLIPVNAGRPAADVNGQIGVDTSAGNSFWYSSAGGGTFYPAAAGSSGNSSTVCTNQVISGIQSNSAPACHTIVGADMANTLTLTGAHSSATYLTATNCSSSASPAVCGSAAAGSVAVPTGVTPVLVVNTTAVTANSQILFTPDESLGTKLSVTCNSTIAQVAIEPIVTARTAATSFTITYNTTVTTNPICLSYFIIN